MTGWRIEEIALDDLVIGKGQVRKRDVGKGIPELAASIRKQGLLEPITVCPSQDQEGKYEILAGQRRYLAHCELQMDSILAVIRDEHIDETKAKEISATENLVREDPVAADYVDLCTDLFHHYGDLKTVAAETGLPYAKVQQYVKFDRLRTEMKDLVRNGEVDLKVALIAQDAVLASGEYKATKATAFAYALAKMPDSQRQKAARVIQEDPKATVERAAEVAKTAEKEYRLNVRIQPGVAKSLKDYAKEAGTQEGDAAADLIREGLTSKGFFDEE